MSIIYDNWERLVAATLKREQLRDLAYCESFSSIASDFSCDSFREDVAEASRFPSKTNISSYSSTSKSNSLPTQKAEILSSPNAVEFEFWELRKATRNFRADSVIGGYGRVYKGWINERTLTAAEPGSGLAIAVRVLHFNYPDCVQERLEKVKFWGQLCHPNLVKLIGYSSDRCALFLVYEFMEKGNLNDYLFRKGPTVSWDARIKVAIGVARGLLFLHDRDSKRVHGDVKPYKILLDGDFSAKLSGPILPECQSDDEYDDEFPLPHIDCFLIDDYFAPECVAEGRLTTKSDVYSFGLVLLELLSGRRAVDKTKVNIEQNLVNWAKPYMGDKRKLFRIMDVKLERQYPRKAAFTAASIALKCLSIEPKLRPCMAEVLATLEELQSPKMASRNSKAD